MSERLSAADWVEAGYGALCRDGFGALKADVLAKQLNVSRGSFYWHFADLAAFHRAVIAHWKALTTEDVIATLKRDRPGADGLAWLIRQALSVDGAAEIAMRAWAKSDRTAAAAVAAVDRRRRGYLVAMLKRQGIAGERANALAGLYYLTYLGNAYATRKLPRRERDLIIAELVAMAERASARSVDQRSAASASMPLLSAR